MRVRRSGTGRTPTLRFPGSADTVREIAVATVDDDVAFFEDRQQRFYYEIDRGAGFHHDQNPAGGAKLAHNSSIECVPMMDLPAPRSLTNSSTLRVVRL